MFKDKIVLNELERICSQLQVSESDIFFRNKRYSVTNENKLVSLVNILYSECYALKENYQNGAMHIQNANFNFEETFVAELSLNNTTQEKITNGWKINKNFQNGYFEVTKNNKNRIIHSSDIRHPHNYSSDDKMISIFQPKEDKYRQPTFYYVFSNETIALDDQITRIYWNIGSKGASKLIQIITQKLNYYHIPFLFKCLNNPNLYFRRDPAVLYVEDKNLQMLSLLLPDLSATMENYLEEDVPLFTFKYSKGIGIAQSPSSKESFGMSRMGILAESLLDLTNKNADTTKTIKHISVEFLKKGINPEAPFLNKGSKILIN